MNIVKTLTIVVAAFTREIYLENPKTQPTQQHDVAAYKITREIYLQNPKTRPTQQHDNKINKIKNTVKT